MRDNAFRGRLTSLPTYLQRDGDLVCTTCGAVIGGNGGGQVRHTTWHAMLAAALLPPDDRGSTDDPPPSAGESLAHDRTGSGTS